MHECSNHIQHEGEARGLYVHGYARVHYPILHLQGCVNWLVSTVACNSTTSVVSESDHWARHLLIVIPGHF